MDISCFNFRELRREIRVFSTPSSQQLILRNHSPPLPRFSFDVWKELIQWSIEHCLHHNRPHILYCPLRNLDCFLGSNHNKISGRVNHLDSPGLWELSSDSVSRRPYLAWGQQNKWLPSTLCSRHGCTSFSKVELLKSYGQSIPYVPLSASFQLSFHFPISCSFSEWITLSLFQP